MKNEEIFIGSQSESQLKAGIKADDEHIFIECLVSDVGRTTVNSDSSGVFLFVSMNDQLYKIWGSSTGKRKVWRRKGSDWIKSPSESKITASVVDEGDSYVVRFAISKDLSKRKPLPYLRLGLALSAHDSNHRHYTEYLANMDVDRPESWLKVKL